MLTENRRNFLKMTGFGLGLAGLSGGVYLVKDKLLPKLEAWEEENRLREAQDIAKFESEQWLSPAESAQTLTGWRIRRAAEGEYREMDGIDTTFLVGGKDDLNFKGKASGRWDLLDAEVAKYTVGARAPVTYTYTSLNSGVYIDDWRLHSDQNGLSEGESMVVFGAQYSFDSSKDEAERWLCAPGDIVEAFNKNLDLTIHFTTRIVEHRKPEAFQVTLLDRVVN